MFVSLLLSFFFFNDTATTEIYTLSLHDALPISLRFRRGGARLQFHWRRRHLWRLDRRQGDRKLHAKRRAYPRQDRKSTRLNSSHLVISYAVFCLKKKK